MNHLYIAPAILVAVGIFVWMSRRLQRHLLKPEEILREMTPHALADLEKILSTSSELGISDELFWKKSGRVRGLLARRKNARCLLHLCQHLSIHDLIPQRDVKFIAARATAVNFFTCLSIAEDIIRKIMPDLPHCSARVAIHLYYEIELRIELVCTGKLPWCDEMLSELL